MGCVTFRSPCIYWLTQEARLKLLFQGPCYCYCCNGGRLCRNAVVTASWPTVQPPDDTWMNVEQRWNEIDRETKELGKNLSQYHLAHHKSHGTDLSAAQIRLSSRSIASVEHFMGPSMFDFRRFPTGVGNLHGRGSFLRSNRKRGHCWWETMA
jgi:hypothetical protein